ncbi:MAG: nucleotidyl transferase AbiEii/AbiGii toxin family protein [Chitinophagaceae bacterium]|nr:nucleotidyl transferase AbiEii/AbiGii toxin family protein [Chitinophagaceae bacterium]
MKHVNENITRIKAVYNGLGDLRDKVVFVGGATVSLYAQREAPDIRETKDVDILVEIASRWEYAAIEEQLRKIGFTNVQESGFLGRYIMDGLIVDLMATDDDILGFTNKWYSEGFKTAIDYTIDPQHTVKIFDPAYFVASKIEAFKNRGKGDGRQSTDFEDIVFILDNRSSIWDEMASVPSPLKEYLKEEFRALSNNPYIDEWIGSHSSFFSPPSAYLIMQDLKKYIET